MVWIASTQPGIWFNFLETCPQNSVIFFYLGNELYSVDQLQLLVNKSCLLSLFVYSPLKNPSIVNLFSALLGAFFDSKQTLSSDTKTYIRNFRTGVEVLQRLKRNKQLFQNIHEIPQGYSSTFAAQLNRITKLFGDANSILENLPILDEFSGTQEIAYDVSFVGQRGNLRRERFIDYFRKSKKVKCFVNFRDQFGGNDLDSDDLYVKASLASKYVLIPPGVFNNYNHRYCESLIMNRLPLVLCNNLTDPNSNYYWVKSFPFGLRDSIRFTYSKVISWDANKIRSQIEVARRVEFERISRFKLAISNYASNDR